MCSSDLKWAFVNINIRPYYAEGSKTYGYEIAEQLGWKAPRHIVVPVAGGSLIAKIQKGLKEFEKLGLIGRVDTRIYAAQATGCCPVITAIKEEIDIIKPVKPNTIAKSLAIGNPADGIYAVGTVKETGGWGEDASDEEIVEAIKILAVTEGVFTETAGGVTLAATRKLIESGRIPRDESIVVCVTGNGLKTQEAVAERIGKPVRIKPNIASFEENVRKALYDKFDEKLIKNSDLLNEVLQYCVAPGKSPNLDSIITYNYDDILEEFLAKQTIKIPFVPIFTVGKKPQIDELPIYHVHGYLPRKGELGTEHKITLSEDIYHEQYNNIYSWNNITQINKFRDNNCLFIGVSLTDPNLRRILDIANTQRGIDSPQHFIFKKRYNTEELTILLEKYLQDNKSVDDEKVLANLKLNETIKYLVSMMEKFEESDAL